MTDLITRQYAVRDHVEQKEHYVRHVSAMTGEGLHAKSAIAAELAHRDIEIERLRAAAQQARAALHYMDCYSRSTILNALRALDEVLKETP